MDKKPKEGGGKPNDPKTISEVIGHLTFKDWDRLSQWAPVAKPFGRYHDIAVAALNFLLTSVIAGTVGFVMNLKIKSSDARAEAARQERLEDSRRAERAEDAKRQQDAKNEELNRQAAKDADDNRWKQQSLLTAERDRRAHLLKEVSTLLSANADLFNAPLSELAGALRRRDRIKPDELDDIYTFSRDLFKNRLKARVMSTAYMAGNSYSSDYDFLTWEIRHLIDALKNLELDPAKESDIVKEANQHIEAIEARAAEKGYADFVPDESDVVPERRVPLRNWRQRIWHFTSKSHIYHLRAALSDESAVK